MNLPPATAEALAHSAALRAHIGAQIDAAGGWLPFARYMALALYAPGLGYYSAGAAKFGAAGDFVTAPEISPLFGRCLARQLAQVLEAGGDILELGAGSGRLAGDVLDELARLGRLPQRYLILEPSPDLAQRQRAYLAHAAGAHAHRVHWVDALPAQLQGAIVANEVLDALPVDLLAWQDDGPRVRGVVRAGEGFDWREGAAPAGALAARARALALPAGYLSEVGLAAEALTAELARCLTRGVLLLIDYGFPRAEFYHPQRSAGTLMCHYRHHAHDDPFHLPGLQDLTAHIDFTAIAAAGTDAGLALAGFTSQANFLVNCGITTLLGEIDAADAARYLPAVAAAQKLLSPAEMGELFKVIAFARPGAPALVGFARGDQRHRL